MSDNEAQVENNNITAPVFNEEELKNKFVDLMTNDYDGKCSEAIQWFRKYLSAERNPPIDKVIEIGALPRLVELLSLKDKLTIQFEAAWTITNIASGTSDHTWQVVNAGAIPIFIEHLSSVSIDLCEQAVWALGNIAGDSSKTRDLVINANVVPSLVNLGKRSDKISIARNVSWTISNLLRGKPAPDFSLLLPALEYVANNILNVQDEEVVTDSLWALTYYTESGKDAGNKVIEQNLIPAIIRNLASPSINVCTPALRIIKHITKFVTEQAQLLFDAGLTERIIPLLTNQRKSLVNESCSVISNIAAGDPNAIQILIDEDIYHILFNMVNTIDFDIRKELSFAIANSVINGTEKQVQYLESLGCIEKLYNFLQENDTNVISIALDALDKCFNLVDFNDYEEDNCFSTFDNYGGEDKLIELQTSQENSIKSKASSIIDKHFPSNDTTISIRVEDVEKEIASNEKDGNLSLENKEVNESIIMEICKIIDKFGYQIKTLNFCNNNMTSSSAKILFQYLIKNKSIKALNIIDNNVDDEAMKDLSELITKNEMINSFSFGNRKGGNQITDKGLLEISSALIGSTCIRSLSFNNNQGITEKSKPIILDILKHSRIEYYNVKQTSINSTREIIVAQSINKILNGQKAIILKSKRLQDEDLHLICEALKKERRYIESIILSKNVLTSKGASELFEVLQTYTPTSLIDLSSNNLDDECAESLADLMQHNQTIRELDLSKNSFTDAGIKVILGSLVGNHSLKLLDLYNCKIAGEIFDDLKIAIEGSHLDKARLSSNVLQKKQMSEIRKLLKVPVDDRNVPINSKSKSAAKIST